MVTTVGQKQTKMQFREARQFFKQYFLKKFQVLIPPINLALHFPFLMGLNLLIIQQENVDMIIY